MDSMTQIFNFYSDYLKNNLTEFIKEIPSNPICLDLGCGDGRYGAMIIEERKDIKLINLDIEKNNYRPKNFIIGDVTKLPFKSNIFDCIIFINVFHHLSDSNSIQISIKEMYRILKKNGMLFLKDTVADNPLRLSCEKIWKYLPANIKKSTGLLEAYCNFNIFHIKKTTLIKFISNYFIIEEKRNEDLFIFCIFYLLKILPEVNILFPLPLVKKITTLEEILINQKFFGKFCASINLIVQKV